MNDRFLKACRREPVDRTPVWFMRQAGRYMPEYREIRSRHSLLDICRTPELATKVTLQPVRRIDVDAAILFSDLLLPLEPMGIPFDFVRGEGPAIENPLRTEADIDRLKCFEPREALAHVLEAIRMIRRELDGPHDVPLIGFAGAPFTLASYAIEGGHSQNFALTKALMYSNPRRVAPALRHARLDHGRIPEGADRGRRAGDQIFDSWVGALSAADYREFVLPHTRKIFDAIAGTGVPTIHFGTGTANILQDLRDAGGDVIGADWRIPLDEAWERIGHDRAIQGNLDPTLLLAPLDRMLDGRRRCARARRRARRDTSSISATAFCRRRRSSTCRRSRSTCTATGSRMPDAAPGAAVLLMAHGTPESVDQMADYLRLVRGGREPSAELIAEMTHNWEAIGGRSPLTDITLQQGDALRAQLAADGLDMPVVVGMRNWRPFIADAMREIARTGARRIIGIPLAPQFSTLSVQKYIDAATAVLPAGVEFSCVRSFHDHPLLIEAFAEKVLAAEPQPDEEIVFTAHSLPQRVAAAGDPYPNEVAATAKAVADRCGIRAVRHGVSERGPDARTVARAGSVRNTSAQRAASGRTQHLVVPDRVRVRPHGNPVRHRCAGRRRRARSRRQPCAAPSR